MMRKSSRGKTPTPPAGSARPQAATFKNSLLLWRERWKAQQAAGPFGPDAPRGPGDEGKSDRAQ
jgi:hypothetical protein